MVGVAVLLLFAAGGVAFAIEWSNRGADEVSIEDVIRRYREQQGAVDGDAGFLRPAEGVYTYEAAGSEALSVLDTDQQWGPTMPATVSNDGDQCWTLRIEYSTNHWQEHRFCRDDRTLRDVGGRSFQRFDFGAFRVSDTNTFECDPPVDAIRVDAEPGARWPHRCTGGSDERGTEVTSSGTTEFVGVEELTVDGNVVGALHYHLVRTLSGDQEGTEDIHHWYSVTDGLLLRATHDTEVASPSPIGDVVYTERGEFQLTSLVPLR